MMTEEDPTIGSKAEADKENIESLKQALAAEKEKADNYLANWQRAQADFINYKRRTEQERVDTGKFANSILMLSLLPVLDDWERAINSIPPGLENDGWVDGIRLIGQKFLASLQAQGLSQIEALGKQFDPNFHEAAGHGKGEEGMVVEELQKGYKLYDRVLRPSKVLVGNGEEEEKKEE